jgi:exodeoxyribonuclease V alpha subunit
MVRQGDQKGACLLSNVIRLGNCGIPAPNQQRAINPPGAVRVDRFGFAFDAGDKVVQIVNDYDKEVHNGDIGRIVTIDLDKAELVIRFDERDISYRFDELGHVIA